MPTTRTKPSSIDSPVRVKPSINNPRSRRPFTLDQELEPFGRWSGKPIFVPPKDMNQDLAKTMLSQSGLMASKESSWQKMFDVHREQFTQVREIDMAKASIRLPKGKLFVSITEQKNFDKITDRIPDCVQTRLDEFLAGPGKESGVKVYYLKPLCVEVGDELIFTSEEDLMSAIDKIREEVFAEYRRLYLLHRPRHAVVEAANAALAIPRAIARHSLKKRQKKIDVYQAKLEFERRKTAFRAAKTHRKFRTDGCTFNEMLDLTNPLQRFDVIEQYGEVENLSRAKRDHLIRMAAGHIPWFVALSITASYLTSIALTISLTPPVLVCDPAFVAQYPGSKTLLKIGHFDEIGGVPHVEI